jgi:hypothetical protein
MLRCFSTWAKHAVFRVNAPACILGFLSVSRRLLISSPLLARGGRRVSISPHGLLPLTRVAVTILRTELHIRKYAAALSSTVKKKSGM